MKDPAPWSAPLRSPRAGAVVAACLAVVVHANALQNGFAYDDVHIVEENEAIHDLSRLPGALVRPYWTNPSGRELGLWRPVTTAAFGLQWAAWGDDPAPYHAVNVLAHAAVTGLVVIFLAQLVTPVAAFLGGAVFAVHPVHVEAVSNLVGLAEVLSALFLLLAALLYVRRRHELGPGSIAGLSLLYALAFLTKESAVTLPAVLVLLDLWLDRIPLRRLPDYLRRRAGLLASLAAVAGAILWARTQVLGSVANPYPPLGADILREIPRIWTVAGVWPHYVRLLLFPLDLSPDYSPAVVEIRHGWDAIGVTGVLTALAFLAVAWGAWRRGEGEGRPWPRTEAVTFAILWFVITVLPVSNLFFLSGVLLAERTLYVPSMGLALGAGWLLWAVGRRVPRTAGIVALAAVALLSLRTWTMTPVWKSTTLVFEHVLQSHPESGRLQWVLADHFYEDRDDPDRALDVYRLAVGVNGRSYPLMIGIIERLVDLDRLEQARALARWTWHEDPRLPQAPTLLAVALAEEGRYQEALEPARAALEAEAAGPGREVDALTHHILARAYAEQGRWEDAIRHRRATIDAGEGHHWMQWLWLAHLEAASGDTASAVAALDSARVRAPGEAPAAGVLDSLRSSWRAPRTGL